MCHTVLGVCPEHPAAKQMATKIVDALMLYDGPNLESIYKSCRDQLQGDCFGQGRVTQEDIDEQAAILEVKGMQENIDAGGVDEVRLVTLEDLSGPSIFSQMIGKFTEIFGSKNDTDRRGLVGDDGIEKNPHSHNTFRHIDTNSESRCGNRGATAAAKFHGNGQELVRRVDGAHEEATANAKDHVAGDRSNRSGSSRHRDGM